MKGKNKLFRLIVSPVILALFIVGHLYHAFKRFGLFVKYGGEFISFDKDERPTVSAMSSGGIRTTHYQNITNDNRKHKR